MQNICRESIASRKVMRKTAMPKAQVRVVAMDSFVDPESRDPLQGYGVQLVPINGAKYGEIGLRDGDELDGSARKLLLQFYGECYDEKIDPAGYAAVLARPGDNSMKIGSKIWCFTQAHRKEIAEDYSMPPCNAGGLINHASEGSGANCTWIVPRGKKNPYPVIKCTDNIMYGGFFYFDYDGGKNAQYWYNHPGREMPRQMPLASDAHRKLIWPKPFEVKTCMLYHSTHACTDCHR